MLTKIVSNFLFLVWLFFVGWLFMSITGCATTKTEFNAYHHAYLGETRPTTQNLDVLMVVRVRGFGKTTERAAAWCKDWPKFCTKNNLLAAGMTVSSEIPEIWVDLRENARGEIEAPAHILGHELQHAIRLYDGRLHDPDK